jgi:hypothetical protein
LVDKIDLAYAYAERDSQQGFFSQGLTDGAKLNQQYGFIDFIVRIVSICNFQNEQIK